MQQGVEVVWLRLGREQDVALHLEHHLHVLAQVPVDLSIAASPHTFSNS